MQAESKPHRHGNGSATYRLRTLFFKNLLKCIVDQIELFDLHTTVLAALAVSGGLVDYTLAAQVGNLLSPLSFQQDGDYPGFGE